MKIIYLFLLIPSIITAQVNPAFIFKSDLNYNRVEYKGDGLFGFESNDKFGYLDKTGKVIIQPEYSYSHNLSFIPEFVNGFTVIKKDGKKGLVDKTGKVVIPFEYETIVVKANSKNVVVVSKKTDNKTLFGLVSTQNKIIIPVNYDNVIADSNLVTVSKNSKWGLLDITGKELLPQEYSSLTAYPKEKILKAEKGTQYGFTDLSGKWLFEKTKSVFSLYSCSEGMIQYIVNSKYGFLDLNGNEAIISKYDYASIFESIGLAKVGKKSPANSYTTLYGFIDKKGTEIIPIKFEYLGSFNNGLVYAKDPETNRYGYLDKTGKWIMNPVFMEATNFDNAGGAWVKMTDARYHYINKTRKDLGQLIENGSTYRMFGKEGYSVIENTDYSYVLIDEKGKILKTIDDCDGIYTFSDGVAGYKSKSKSLYGFLDLNGNKIIPPEYSSFTGFTDGVSKVSKAIDGKTKSGYLTNKNEIFLPIRYDTVYGFRDGWGLIKNNGKYFFVDRNGNLKDPPRNYDVLVEFRSGFALGKVNGSGDNPNTYYYI
ncbi:MAG TPA: WG repeat-containing protein, partial [Chitinophagaceae bacterium]|nr:WG repeat-containing protein [Chitinophagaceae bacterium]